jgi:glycosyltransferase involved in cell wall biosynthesis
MDDALDFSIVICAYTLDRWAELVASVASAQRQTLPARDVVLVVDNNEELFQRATDAFSGVMVLSNEELPGLGGARNIGAAAAQGTIIAFLDDDAVAADDWLEQLSPGYIDPKVLGVGGFIEPMWPAAGPPRWFPPEFNWVVGCTYTGVPKEIATVRNLIGANMSIRAEVIESAGGFDGDLGRRDRPGERPTGSVEDTEFCIRASRLYPSGTWLYRPMARVTHLVSPQRATWRFFVGRCRLEGAAKARLVGLAGSKSGLASERRYVISTLPTGVARGLSEALRGHLDGVGRAGAIVVGFLFTAASYLRGRPAAASLSARHACSQ